MAPLMTTGAGGYPAAGGGSSLLTWNPSDKAAAVVLSNSNLTAAVSGNANWQSVRGLAPYASGSKYFAVNVDAAGTNSFVGLTTTGFTLANSFPGASSTAVWFKDGSFYLNGSDTGGTQFPYTNSDVLLLGYDGSTINFFKNGSLARTFSFSAGTVYPTIGFYTSPSAGQFTSILSSNPSGYSYTAW